MEKNQIVQGEQRYSTTGMYQDRLLTVIHTYDEESSHESARVISVRKATPSERARYERQRAEAY
jgi:uncharacterized DUF497 family protein